MIDAVRGVIILLAMLIDAQKARIKLSEPTTTVTTVITAPAGK
jgi:hypothetical protein